MADKNLNSSYADSLKRVDGLYENPSSTRQELDAYRADLAQDREKIDALRFKIDNFNRVYQEIQERMQAKMGVIASTKTRLKVLSTNTGQVLKSGVEAAKQVDPKAIGSALKESPANLDRNMAGTPGVLSLPKAVISETGDLLGKAADSQSVRTLTHIPLEENGTDTVLNGPDFTEAEAAEIQKMFDDSAIQNLGRELFMTLKGTSSEDMKWMIENNINMKNVFSVLKGAGNMVDGKEADQFGLLNFDLGVATVAGGFGAVFGHKVLHGWWGQKKHMSWATGAIVAATIFGHKDVTPMITKGVEKTAHYAGTGARGVGRVVMNTIHGVASWDLIREVKEHGAVAGFRYLNNGVRSQEDLRQLLSDPENYKNMGALLPYMPKEYQKSFVWMEQYRQDQRGEKPLTLKSALLKTKLVAREMHKEYLAPGREHWADFLDRYAAGENTPIPADLPRVFRWIVAVDNEVTRPAAKNLADLLRLDSVDSIQMEDAVEEADLKAFKESKESKDHQIYDMAVYVFRCSSQSFNAEELDQFMVDLKEGKWDQKNASRALLTQSAGDVLRFFQVEATSSDRAKFMKTFEDLWADGKTGGKYDPSVERFVGRYEDHDLAELLPKITKDLPKKERKGIMKFLALNGSGMLLASWAMAVVALGGGIWLWKKITAGVKMGKDFLKGEERAKVRKTLPSSSDLSRREQKNLHAALTKPPSNTFRIRGKWKKTVAVLLSHNLVDNVQANKMEGLKDKDQIRAFYELFKGEDQREFLTGDLQSLRSHIMDQYNVVAKNNPIESSTYYNVMDQVHTLREQLLDNREKRSLDVTMNLANGKQLYIRNMKLKDRWLPLGSRAKKTDKGTKIISPDIYGTLLDKNRKEKGTVKLFLGESFLGQNFTVSYSGTFLGGLQPRLGKKITSIDMGGINPPVESEVADTSSTPPETPPVTPPVAPA